jgi:hypothetical protein
VKGGLIMNKKNYIVPTMTVVNVNMQHTLLTGSGEVGITSTEYDAEENGAIRSRSTSLWDDEE